MKITEINVTIVKRNIKSLYKDGVLAYVKLVFENELVVKNIRVVRSKGKLVVAMPNIETNRDCPSCGNKNPITSSFCKFCGNHLERLDIKGPPFKDVVHPLNSDLRKYMEETILKEFSLQEKAT